MEFKASQIAQLVNGEIVGNPDATVCSFGKIEQAVNGDITFLSNTKYTHFIYTTEASVVLVRRDFEADRPIKATLIKVDDPYATLSQLLETASAALIRHPRGMEQPCHVAEGVAVPDDAYIGAFAYVGEGVTLGNNVKIYPGAYIGHGVSIGDDTIVYAGAKIYYGCRIGSRCIIHAGAVIGADGFGFAPMPDGSYHKIPQIGIVVIEDDVEIGANTTVDRATMGATVIHRGVKLDNLIQAAHNTEIGANTVMAAQAGVAGSTKIGSSCMIGGQVGIAGHISIGNGVQAAAQTGVPHSVPDGEKIMGSPALPAHDYMRQTVHIKRLESLFDRVGALEKALKKEK